MNHYDPAARAGRPTPLPAQMAQTVLTALVACAALPALAAPAVTAPFNVYSSSASDKLRADVGADPQRVYVPNLRSNDVYVIDPETLKVIDKFKVGRSPQHIVPSWDMRTLWVTNNAEGRTDGSLTPIDAHTGKPGAAKPVDDPYNMYATPDGKSAIVVAEAKKRLDFRDPKTMALQYSIEVPGCGGINHADFSIDGSYAVFTCEFTGAVAKIDLAQRKVAGYLQLKMPARRLKAVSPTATVKPGQVWEPGETEICTATKGMPQDIRISPDGKRLYVADMAADGLHVVDAATLTEVGYVVTGLGAHGLYPSRDGTKLYIANRGSHRIHNGPKGDGGVTVMDFATEKVVAYWPVPGGGSPDMGNVSADGRWLWLSGRFDDVVYRFDTGSGHVDTIKVGQEPHGLTVWPQPGQHSLGHTGNTR